MISKVSNNRTHTPQKQNFKGAKIILGVSDASKKAVKLPNLETFEKSEPIVRTITTLPPRQALSKLQQFLARGVDNLSQDILLLKKPKREKGSSKKVIHYTSSPFKNRDCKTEEMSYSIFFSLDKKDSNEYKRAFNLLFDQMKINNPVFPLKAKTPAARAKK